MTAAGPGLRRYTPNPLLGSDQMTTVEQTAERDDRLSRREEPATRGDLAVLAAEIRAEVAGLRSEIAALESRLLWRLLGGGGALLLLSRLADFLS